MATRNTRIRFCHNNMGEDAGATYSSETSPYTGTNALLESRYDYWSFEGNFVIDSTNNKIYVDEGVGTVTITLTSAEYTAVTLATHIAAQLNAGLIATWTCTYSSSTYKFTLTSSDSADIVEFSNTTNSVMDTLGFTTPIDANGGSWTSDEVRIHTYEYADFDLTLAQEVTFFALIGPLDEALTLSTNAVVKIQGSNINSFSSPQVDVTVTRTTDGYFAFIDDVSDTTYRYWRIYIEDKLNPNGPESIKIGHIYIGDYDTITARNVQNGFIKTLEDPTEVFKSKNNSKFFNRKTKYTALKSLSLPFLPQADREELEQMFYDIGIDQSFYISLDPTLSLSSDLSYLTKYVRFASAPTLTHIVNDIYSMSFEVEETI